MAQETVQLTERVGLKKHKYLANATVSPNGKLIASAGYGGEIVLWDTARAKEVGTLEHKCDVHCLRFSQDGKMLVSGGKDQRAVIWDVESRKQARIVTTVNGWWITDAEFTPDDKRVAIAAWNREDGASEIQLYDLQTGRSTSKVKFVSGYLVRISFLHMGNELAVAVNRKEGGHIAWWDLKNSHFGTVRLITDEVINLIGSHPNGNVLASDSNQSTWIIDRRKEKLHSVMGTLVGTLAGGKMLVTANQDYGLVYMWDYEKLELRRTLRLDKGEITQAIFADGSQVLSTNRSGLVTIWDLEGQLKRK